MAKTSITCVAILALHLTSAFGVSLEERVAKLEEALASQSARHDADLSALRTELAQEKKLSRELLTSVTKLSSMSEYARPTRQHYNSAQIAFFAKIGQNVDHLGQNQVIVFDDLVTDIDSTNSLGSYNNSSGIFTAPLDGVYVFSVTMHSLNHDTTHHGIFLNDQQITTIYVHGGELATSDSTSQTVVLLLHRGDTVSVHHIESNHGAWGAGHSLFSGFLLYDHEFEGSSGIIG